MRGRAFSETDRAGATPVAIVSEDVAAAVWPGDDPIGKRLKMGSLDSAEGWKTVIGIARTVRYGDITQPHATLYLPDAQFIVSAEMLAVQTTAPLDVVASIVRDRVRVVDANVYVTRIARYDQLRVGSIARQRFNALLLGLFGGAALLLAAIGLYAVMAAYVRQRDREIGIRMAVGATAAAVRRLVLGEALRLAGAGAGIGLVGAAASTRVVRGMIFGVDPMDPATIIGAALLLMVAATLASYAPVRRATRLDAAALLRGE